MKKLISILSTLVLALQLTTAYAAGTPTVSISKAVDAKVGDTVTLTLKMENVDKWSNVWWEINYDSTALKQTRTPAKLVQGLDIYGDNSVSLSQNNTQKPFTVPYNIGWNSSTATCTYSGDMATLYFQVLEGAEAGKEYPITIKSYVPAGNVDGVNVNFWEDVDVDYTGDKTALGFTYVNGSITIAGGAVETTLKAVKTADGVDITATGEEIAGKFIVAAYDADGLANVEVLDAAATAKSTVKGDNVKVMWWDSLEGLNSIVPAVLAE